MIVYPSILEKKAEDLFNQIIKLSPYFNTFQIDIADGIDVPNQTVQMIDIIDYLQQLNPSTTLRVNNQVIEQLNFEFHLMVTDYQSAIKQIQELQNKIRINDILIHASLFPDFATLYSQYSIPLGLVLYPEDSVKTIASKYDLHTIPFIQIMSVHPGVQGNPFLPETLLKIEQLRDADYRNKILLDGGINEKTIPIIQSQKNLPDILCPGSFLTKAKNIEERVSYLKNI